MLDVPPMPTALAPHKQPLDHRMAHGTPGRGGLAPVTPPRTIVPGQALPTLGAGRVHRGGLLVHGVYCWQGALA